MTTQIRNRVFETNSSSSHSITVSGTEAADFGLGRDVLRSGVISIDQSSNFGWEWTEFHGTKDKIAYMLMQCDPEGFSDGVEQGEDIVPLLAARNDNARWLVDMIERVTGCTVEFRAGTWAGIDHQSHGEGDEMFSHEEMMRTFLFSTQSYLQTGNDNSSPWDYE
ncbi:hypothetical protein G6L37_00835 [Agrobacterium rubi]|nr:hypothetical protein [Agrobacterium rubi]NTF23936.1 hypothetical protein [Agrobacterium rubi]